MKYIHTVYTSGEGYANYVVGSHAFGFGDSNTFVTKIRPFAEGDGFFGLADTRSV